jgi:hypothetical protein
MGLARASSLTFAGAHDNRKTDDTSFNLVSCSIRRRDSEKMIGGTLNIPLGKIDQLVRASIESTSVGRGGQGMQRIEGHNQCSFARLR